MIIRTRETTILKMRCLLFLMVSSKQPLQVMSSPQDKYRVRLMVLKVSFIGGGNRACRMSLTNFIT